MELHEEIAAMREYIIEHGWCQWQLRDNRGRVCLTGAASEAFPFSLPLVDTFLSELAIELELVEPYTTLDRHGDGTHLITYEPEAAILAFNNHPDTTERDVIEFLCTAEIRAKELA